MLVFYLLVLAWFISFAVHIMRPCSRWWAVRITVTVSIMTGFLSPCIFMLEQFRLNRRLYSAGLIDPHEYAESVNLSIFSGLTVAVAAALMLCLSVWSSFLAGFNERSEKLGSR